MSVCDISQSHIYALFSFHISSVQKKYLFCVTGCSSQRPSRRVYNWYGGLDTDIGVDYIKEIVLRIQLLRHTVL